MADTELILLNNLERDLNWFGSHIAYLKEKYDEKFVAVKNEEVISADSDFDKLIKKLKALGENPAELLVKFVSNFKIN